MPKMLMHEGDIFHRREEALKICPIRERSELYLEDPASSRIADACETSTPEK